MRHPTPTPNSPSPNQFIELLRSADGVQVSEIAPQALAQPASVENALRDFEKDGPAKSFLVFVRQKPADPEPATPEIFPQDYLSKNAELLLASGEFVLARNIYSFLLKENIKNAEALKGLGICLQKLGQVPAARKCFKALWELHQNPEAYVWLGLCHVLERQDTLAIHCFKKIQAPEQLSPEEAFELFRELGNCQTRCGEFDEAAKNYQSALAVKPLSDNLYVNLGTLEIQRNRLEAATDHFRQAIEINPKNSRAHCGLGLVHVQQGDRASAEAALHAALDLDSQNSVALIQLVTLGLPNDQRVVERLNKFLENEPKNTDVRYARAVCQFKSGQWATCDKELDQLLKIDPGHFNARQLKQELSNNKHTQF